MDTKEALSLARLVKDGEPINDPVMLRAALVALLDHGDKVLAPDFDTAIGIVAANLHALGKTHIEISVHPATKEVDWNTPPVTRGHAFSLINGKN